MDKEKQMETIKDLFKKLNINRSARIIDVTNGKALTPEEFALYLENELCNGCPDKEECLGKKKEPSDELLELARPLLEWLNKNYDTHHKIIIDCDSVELLGGEIGVPCDDYIQD